MIIKVSDLFKILNRLNFSVQEELCLCFDEINGFQFINNNTDVSLLEEELNSLYVLNDYLTIQEIANHLNVSKPTVRKIIKDYHISTILVDGIEKVSRKEYLSFLLGIARK